MALLLLLVWWWVWLSELCSIGEMAYRRRHGITRASTFKEEIRHPPSSSSSSNLATPSPLSSLAAQAIRASAAHRDSSLSSAYGDSAFHSSFKSDSRSSKVPVTYEYTSLTTPNEAGGFWGVLARKAKAILDDDDLSEQFGTPNRADPSLANNSSYSTAGLLYQPHQSHESSRKVGNPSLRKGLDALTSSLNQIGGTIGNALEEGRSMVENKTADIIQETRKLQIGRKGTNSEERIHVSGVHNPWQEPPMSSAQPQIQSNQETQLKASRDVAMATAAKAKLLLRELKTVKADLAFAKQRCSQLEGENKILREAYENGDHPAADDDMIRLQLETLLAEKARLAHENSIFARENRFLMEIVEYHQLTMQDVVYLDEGIEEVTEVYPIPAVSRMLSVSPPSPGSPCSAPEVLPRRSPTVTKESCAPISAQVITNVLQTETNPSATQLQSISDVPDSEAPPSSNSPVSTPKASTRQPNLSA